MILIVKGLIPMKKRILAALTALILLVSSLSLPVLADEEPWWEQDAWSLETLIELGAEAPVWNASRAVYEISKPEQLLFMSGAWKMNDGNGDGVADAPADGNYVLLADLDMEPLMKAIAAKIKAAGGPAGDGYMPPIAAFCDDTHAGEKSAFFGSFDGGFHFISNLNIQRLGDKYAGLFGNIGHDYGEGFVRDLALIDIYVHAKASCGLLAGAIYGEVENIVVTGSILCEEKTAGGLAGKIKKNENGCIGLARNCFIDCTIRLSGTGSENGAVGGVTSSNSGGGAVYNCYTAGSIYVADEGADCVAGISGNLKNGKALEGNVMLLSDIFTEDGTNVGLLCGSFAGESGSHLNKNYVWEGTRMAGNVASDHPLTPSFETVGAADILSKKFYTDTVGWDFDKVWTWVGSDTLGYPMIRGFEGLLAGYEEKLASSLRITAPVLRPSEPMVNTAYEGEAAEITATLLLPEGSACSGMRLVYGSDKNRDKLSDSVEMTEKDGLWTVAFPETKINTYYYYIDATVDGESVSFPTKGAMKLSILSAAAKYAPKFITITPGATVDAVGFNWITDQEGLTGELRIRPARTDNWTIIPATEVRAYTLGDGYADFTSYSVDVTGLSAGSSYEYMAVTSDGSKSYLSEVYSFSTLPERSSFSFAVISDLQGTTEESYLPFKYTMEGFLAENPVNFIINVGDLTEDNTMAQWTYMFNTIGGILASKLTAYAPGNHENKGDLLYTLFKGGTNLPGGIDDAYIDETTSAFVVGDVCFVTLNTEPYKGIDGADAEADKRAFYEAQKEWAREVFEASGCKWRILCSHAGLIQEDDIATAFLEQMCDELNVDLYFNGHIHNYYRASVLNGAHAAVGEGTTFITTSPMGTKFDPYEGEIDDILDFQTGGKDDERQYFTRVDVTDTTLTVTAYQRTSSDEASAKNCKEYEVIDTITLTKIENDNLKPEEPEKPEHKALPYIIGGGAAAAAVIAAAIIIGKKKSKKA